MKKHKIKFWLTVETNKNMDASAVQGILISAIDNYCEKQCFLSNAQTLIEKEVR